MPLTGTDIVPLMRAALDLRTDCNIEGSREPDCLRINELIASKRYQVLKCTYDADESSYSPVFVFWYQKSPDRASFSPPGGYRHPFSGLGSTSLATCPANVAAAEAERAR